MCNNTIVLGIFIILKIVAVFILPIIIFIKRRSKNIIILVIIDILLLLFFVICNTFTINKCVYNSNLNGLKRIKNENKIVLYNKLHHELSPLLKTIPYKEYKTYLGKDLYYFNINSSNIKKEYQLCNGKKVYLNSVGSGITSFSIAISTLFQKNIDPNEIFKYYKEDYDICETKITINNIYKTVMKKYGAITLDEIDKSQIESSIKNGGLVIAELQSNENSKITCDSGYIVIYSVGLDDKFIIADPSLPKSSYVCPYSSDAYGNVISSNNMTTAWSLSDINNEAVRYYLVKRV